MPLLSELTYLVTDVETTGCDPVAHRIIEIGCVVVQGGEIIERFSSLVNPHQYVPPFIEQLTGISNADLFLAPEEHEVIEQLAPLFELPNAVFVAHQAQFDWRFVEAAFARCGRALPELPRLCTYRLARRLLPPAVKKNLGALAEYFGVSVHARHRAYGDAEATAYVLLHLLEELERSGIETLEEALHFQHRRLQTHRIPKRVLRAIEPQLNALPALPGVYRMYGGDGELLYVGKAKVLSERVRSYFQPSSALAEHIQRMVRQVRSIEWEETPTELSALLREAELIRRHQPPFNVLQRKSPRAYFLRLTGDAFSRLEIATEHAADGEHFGPFPSRSIAESIAAVIEEHFRLRRCNGELQVDASVRPCLYYHLRRCGAPCAELQSWEEYQREVARVRSLLAGNVEWLIMQLEARMRAAAERLEFEHARVLLHQVRQLQRLALSSSLALPHLSLALLVPTAYEPQTLELFLIVRGRLVVQQVIGRCAPLDWLLPYLERRTAPAVPLSAEELTTLRIITGWMYRNPQAYLAVDVPEQCSGEELLRRIASAARSEMRGIVASPQRRYVPLGDDGYAV